MEGNNPVQNDRVNKANQNVRAMTPQAFIELGVGEVVYIRPVPKGNDVDFVLYGANGQAVGMQKDYQAARELAWENNLAVVSLN